MFVRVKKSCVAISFVHKGNVDIILLMLDKNRLCYINGLCTQSYKINELRRDSRTCNITFCNTVLNSKQYVTFNCIIAQLIHNHNFLCRRISKESLIRLVSYCVGSEVKRSRHGYKSHVHRSSTYDPSCLIWYS